MAGGYLPRRQSSVSALPPFSSRVPKMFFITRVAGWQIRHVFGRFLPAFQYFTTGSSGRNEGERGTVGETARSRKRRRECFEQEQFRVALGSTDEGRAIDGRRLPLASAL